MGREEGTEDQERDTNRWRENLYLYTLHYINVVCSLYCSIMKSNTKAKDVMRSIRFLPLIQFRFT